MNNQGNSILRYAYSRYASIGRTIYQGLIDFSPFSPGGKVIQATGEVKIFLKYSKMPFKGNGVLSNAGRAVTKHPNYFGFKNTNELKLVYRTDEQLNSLANSTVNEILTKGIRTTGSGGRYPNGWVTYTLPDGRAASWHKSGEFIGFRGVGK